MEIYYRDNKVHYATIFYASTVKQRPIHMTPDMKEELEDAESEYIASQVLLKRFHPKH